MATRKTKGRGAPGRAKSAAHREALSKALKAFHAKRKGKRGTRKTTVRKPRAKTSLTRKTRTIGKRKISATSRSSASRVSPYPVDIINGHHYDARTGELKKSSTIYTIGKNGRKYPLKNKKSLTPAQYLARKKL